MPMNTYYLQTWWVAGFYTLMRFIRWWWFFPCPYWTSENKCGSMLKDYCTEARIKLQGLYIHTGGTCEWMRPSLCFYVFFYFPKQLLYTYCCLSCWINPKTTCLRIAVDNLCNKCLLTIPCLKAETSLRSHWLQSLLLLLLRRDTAVRQGDVVNIIGSFDDSNTCHVTDGENFVVVDPDRLISGTTIVSSLHCMRRWGILSFKPDISIAPL